MLKKKILKNGLRLILAPQPASLAATVLVLVEAGSEYETKDKNGISHFLEHLVFKGTTNRPKPGMIAAELDSLGAEYNAFTSQEYTGYWAKVQNHKLPHVLELVSDLYVHPIFNPQEIEKERGVIIEEVNMYEDMPMRRVDEFFMSLLYGDQPAGWDIAGKKEIIKKLNQEDFLEYRKGHYVAPATVVVIAGAFSPEKVIKQAEMLFSPLGDGKKPAKSKTVEKQKKPEVFVKFKDSDQSHLALGTRAFNTFDQKKYALQVLGEILGGGMSSRLFVKVREEMGAAYHIRANSDLFLDHGFFQVSAGVDHSKIDKVLKAILEEMTKLTRELVSPQEMKKVKDHMVGNLILGLETSDELAGFYGSQEITYKDFITPKEMVEKIEKVRSEEVRDIARMLFRNDKLNLAVIGPHKKASAFQKILTF